MAIHTIRISKWNLNLDLDVLTDKRVLVRFSDLKEYLFQNRKDLIEKFKIRSKLLPDGYTIKIYVAWDSVLEELIETKYLEEIIYGKIKNNKHKG